LAREYATTRPAAIRLNYGVQRSERGAMAVRTIALLPALIGSWKDMWAAGCSFPPRKPFTLNRKPDWNVADLQWRALGRRGAHGEYVAAG
jgi:anaerobic selenocysteine-containing dehydrogenase